MVTPNAATTSDRTFAIDALHAATALYTSMPVVEALLDRMGWPDADGRLLDPSAGDGSFLVSALRRIATPAGDFDALGRVQGWEMHPQAVEQSRERIVDLLTSRGWIEHEALRGAEAVAHEGDFLTADPQGTFRFVAGNPPYLRWGHLPAILKETWSPVLPAFARGDLLHAFLDRSVSIMPEDGVIGLVTSDRWLFNATTTGLRRTIGRKAGISHLARLDAATSFYRPKTRRKNSAPRVHPVEVVLRPLGEDMLELDGRPISPDGAFDEVHEGPVLADVATVKLAPWLGPKGIFLLHTEQAMSLPGADLLPAVDSDDIDPLTDVLGAPTRFAIRTSRDAEPAGAVRDHLLSARERMPKRGRLGRWWMPPEAITLPLDRPAILVPRIGKRIRAVRLPAGVLPVNHNLYVVAGQAGRSLDEIESHLLSETTQAWVSRHAPRLEDGYLDIRAGLIRRIPIGGDTICSGKRLS